MVQSAQRTPLTTRPPLRLRVEGVGKDAYDGMLSFFSLAGGYAWPGTLWVSGKRVYKRSPWAAEYAGNYARNYFDLLSGGSNDWRVSLVSPPAPAEESTS